MYCGQLLEAFVKMLLLLGKAPLLFVKMPLLIVKVLMLLVRQNFLLLRRFAVFLILEVLKQVTLFAVAWLFFRVGSPLSLLVVLPIFLSKPLLIVKALGTQVLLNFMAMRRFLIFLYLEVLLQVVLLVKILFL